MNRSLRDVLAESHIAAVAIAILVFWALVAAIRGILPLIVHAVAYLFTAVAILDVPSFSVGLYERILVLKMCYGLFGASVTFAVAWLLSIWTYRVAPFQALSNCRSGLLRRNDV